MKARILFLIMSCCLLISLAPASPPGEGTDKGIRFFQGSWEDALKEARQQRKLIFLDISTSWCKSCRIMSGWVFQDEAVAAFFNRHFINVYADGDGALGKELGNRYDRVTYPTLCFVDGSGNGVGPVQGSMMAEELLDWARSVLPPPKAIPVSDAPEYRSRMAPAMVHAAGVMERAEHKVPAVYAGRVREWSALNRDKGN